MFRGEGIKLLRFQRQKFSWYKTKFTKLPGASKVLNMAYIYSQHSSEAFSLISFPFNRTQFAIQQLSLCLPRFVIVTCSRSLIFYRFIANRHELSFCSLVKRAAHQQIIFWILSSSLYLSRPFFIILLNHVLPCNLFSSDWRWHRLFSFTFLCVQFSLLLGQSMPCFSIRSVVFLYDSCVAYPCS